MKKLSFFISLLALLCVALTSCFAESVPPADPPSGAIGVTVFSPDIDVSIVKSDSATTADGLAYNTIADALYALRGKSPSRLTDSIAQRGSEIAIGRTSRPASIAAYERLAEAKHKDGIAYVILVKDGVLAIAAETEASMTEAVEYFVDNFLTSDTLTLSSSFVYFADVSADEYRDLVMAPIIETEVARFEHRWDELIATADAETVAAFKRLYSFYGTDVIYWFANLFDGENGGFYYANSSRDYEGFLPDLESTAQTFSFLRDSGAISYYSNALIKALPEWMQEKILKFVWDCADPDGYYYHPQWGKNIGSSRRARDLDNAISINTSLKGEYRYPTAREQMAAGTSATCSPVTRLTSPLYGSVASAVSSVIATVSSADCLDSAENMIAWLDSMDFKRDSHNPGHAVSCLSAEIVAKGYGKLVCDYFTNLLEEVQEELRDTAEADLLARKPDATAAEISAARKNAENGLWQTTVDYTSLSGLYKICRIYNAASIDFPVQYAMAAVRSSVEAMKQETNPTYVIHVFNPWAGLNTLMTNMKNANSRAKGRGESEIHDMNAAYEVVRADAPALIEKTVEKLALFRKSDGSFSYYQNISAPTTQGTLVSMGFEEGDVNSTMIGITAITNAMFATMGYTRVPLLHLGHFEEFVKIIESADPIIKIELETDNTFDFNDGEFPALMQVASSSGEVLEVVDDPTAKGHGGVLSFAKSAGAGSSISFSVPATVGGMTSFVYEADYCIYQANDNQPYDNYQITIKGASDQLYMFTLCYDSSGDVVIGDDSSTNAGNVNRFASAKCGEWFNLRIEGYQLDDGSLRFKLYLGGKLIGVSDNYYNSHENAKPAFGFVGIQVYAMMRTDATLLIDNVHTASYNDVEFVDESASTEGEREILYSFDSGSPDYIAKPANANSQHGVAPDPKNSANNSLHITKSDTVMGVNDIYSFASPEYRGDDISAIEVSLDIYFDSAMIYGATDAEAGKDWTALNPNLFQLSFGSISSGAKEALYCLLLRYDGDGIILGDTNSSSSPKITNLYDKLRLSFDTWHTVTVRIERGASTSDFLVTLSLDGVSLTSQNYYNQSNSTTKIPNKFFDSFDIRPLARAAFDMYVDNIRIAHISEK